MTNRNVQEIIISSDDDEQPGASGNRRRQRIESTSNDDSSCSLCMEPFTDNGTHRLTCLKCGHLFGRSCIMKWLRGETVNNRTCPTCKEPANCEDIRSHFSLSPVFHPAEKEELLTKLEQEKAKRQKIAHELSNFKRGWNVLRAEIDILRDELDESRATFDKRNEGDNCQQNESNFELKFIQNLEVCKEGQCRVMNFCQPLNLLAVAASENSTMPNGWGIQKIDMQIMRSTDFVELHSDVVSDIKISYNTLTASFDKTLCLSSLHNNCPIQKWNVGQRVSSCCFKTDQPWYVFGATQTGRVLMYDTRMIYSRTSQNPGLGNDGVGQLRDLQKPVFGLHWVQNAERSGLLASSTDRCIFFHEKSPANYESFTLISEGQQYAVSYADEHILVSHNPSFIKRSTTEHTVYGINGPSASSGDENSTVNQAYRCERISNLKGGPKQTSMCRNLLSRHPNDDSKLVGLIYEESLNLVQVWNISENLVVQKLPFNVGQSVYDIERFTSNDTNLYAFLNSNIVTFFSY